MLRHNYHTHTYRCGHAVGEDEDYIFEAIGLGLQTLGFSDHVMLEGFSQPGVRGDFELSEDYFTSIKELKEKYKDKRILLVTHGGVSIPVNCYFNGIPDEDNIFFLCMNNCEVAKFKNE